jgi:hypothetical protein
MSDPRRPAGPGSMRSGARLDRIRQAMMRRIAPARPPVAVPPAGQVSPAAPREVVSILRTLRPVADGRPDGFCKLIADRRSPAILGAHALGE